MNRFDRRTAIFYLAAIAFLSCWLAWRRADDRWPKLLSWSAKTAGEAREIIEKNTRTQFYKVEKQARAYRNPFNEKLFREAEAIQKSLQSLGLESQSLLDCYFLKAEQGVQEDLLLDPFLQKWAAARDSIFRAVEADSVAKTAFLSIFPAKLDEKGMALAHARFQKLTAAEAISFVKTEVLRTEVAAFGAMKSLAEKAVGEKIVFDAFWPVVSPAFKYEKGKAFFKSDIFLSAYSTTANNVRGFVNEHERLLENGLGHWSQTFTAGGEKQIHTDFHVQNPLTGQIQTWKAEYGIYIKP